MQAQLAALADLHLPSVPDPGQGTGGLQSLLNLFYVLLAFGFLLAIIGHVTKLRPLIIVGLGMIFVGTAAFLLAVGGSG
jgi:hypothetical protein